MRIFKYMGALLVLLLPTWAGANDLGFARLSLIEGDVQVLIQDTSDWTPATINLPMNEHDRLWVAESGRAELQIQGGVYARTDGNSSLDVLTINRDSAQFYLDQGHLYINNRRGGINTVQIDTSLASIRSYDNSIMMVDVAENNEIEISVLKGVAYAESRAGSTSVSAGNTLTIRSESNAEISPISAPDQWEEWNVARDREVTAWSESSRYLPDELHEYSSDFDQYGRWEYDSEYGYVWSPVVVAADWAPYSYGNWVWIRGSYVWIDYDPWGWAPSHYGRWVFAGGRGWCWVPPALGAVYWGPGYVGWVVTPSYVAWVPLAPGETYYGYGYYGPHSVNITTVNVNTVVVNRNYRNAVVRNSVVVVNRNSFGTGQRVPARIKENPFENRGKRSDWHNVNVVPPKVRPDKPVVVAPAEARQHTQQMLRDRDRRIARPEGRAVTPSAPTAERPEQRQTHEQRHPNAVNPRASTPVPQAQQQPPERIRRNRPQDLKNERPLVRQRDASVFQPRQPDNLPVRRSNQPRVINRPPQQQPQQGAQGHGKPQQQRRQQQEERGHGR